MHPIRYSMLAGVVILSACASMNKPGNPTPAIEADRPDFTESPETVRPGFIQAEGGYTYSRVESGSSQSIGELLVRVPAGARTELRVGFNSYTIEHASGVTKRGFEDIEIGTKVRIVEQEARSIVPTVSILMLSTLPTGRAGIGSKEMQPTAKLALGWQLSEKNSLQSNTNYTYASEDGMRFSQWATSASLGTEFTPRLETFLEWFGTSPASLGASRADYLDTGGAVKFGSSVRLDARIGINARTSMNYFAGVGLSYRW